MVPEQLNIDSEISSENIEKCKSLRHFGEVNFAIIANRDMGNFVHFWQFFGLVNTLQLILSSRLQIACSLG